MAQEKDRGSELLTQIGEQDGVREKLRRMARQNKLAAFSAVLIALVLTPLGITANGATRWLNLGVSVQPAEIAKLCMILFLAMLRRIRKFRFILLAYDIFPENTVAAGLCRGNSAKYKLSKRLFDWAYGQADIVIAIGRDMHDILIRKGVAPEHIRVVTNWCPEHEIIPSPKNDNGLIKKFALQNKTVFLFAGNLGRVQGIPNLLDAIALTSHDNAAFLFIGDGAMKSELEKFKDAHPDKHIYSIGNQPIDKANDFLSAGDVAVIPLASGMLGLGVPSKSYFYMAAGMPLLFIGSRDSEIAITLKEENNGWQVDPDSPEKLAAMIDQITTANIEELSEYSHRSRTAAEKRFAEKLILQQFNQIIIEQN